MGKKSVKICSNSVKRGTVKVETPIANIGKW